MSNTKRPGESPRRLRVTKARRPTGVIGPREPLDDLPSEKEGVPQWLNARWAVPLVEGRPAGVGYEVAERMAAEVLINPERLLDADLPRILRLPQPDQAREWKKHEVKKLRLELTLVKNGEPPPWVKLEARLKFVRALRAFPEEWPTPESIAEMDAAALAGLPIPPPKTFKAIQLPMPAIAALAWFAGLMERPTAGSVLALGRLLRRHDPEH